jgi:hypothetical protein
VSNTPFENPKTSVLALAHMAVTRGDELSAEVLGRLKKLAKDCIRPPACRFSSPSVYPSIAALITVSELVSGCTWKKSNLRGFLLIISYSEWCFVRSFCLKVCSEKGLLR